MTTKFSRRKNDWLSSENRMISATATSASPMRPEASPGAFEPGSKAARERAVDPRLPGAPSPRLSPVIPHLVSTLEPAGSRQHENRPPSTHVEKHGRYFVSDDQGKFTYWSRVS